MKSPWPFILALIIGALVFWNSETGRLLSGRWSFTKSVETDRGTYFRLVMDFGYRGEPQRFDVVFGCNARITRYRDGGSSYEPGLTPQLYGRLMSDGQIVAVRTPLACRGETTANGKVPEAILPLMLVYPIAEKPDFAVAYATSDAYRSPHAELTRPKARIEAATNADFMAFRARADNALARPAPGATSIAERALSTQEAEQAGFRVADICEAFLRIRLPERVRVLVREHWPADRPTYWTGRYVTEGEWPNQRHSQPPVNEVRAAIMWDEPPEALVHADTPEDPLTSLTGLTWGGGFQDAGMPNAENARMWGRLQLGAVYPAGFNKDLTDPAKAGRHRVPWATIDRPIGRTVDRRDLSMRGFAYCRTSGTGSDVGVDGQPLVGPSLTGSFFERDEYYYTIAQMSISIRGGCDVWDHARADCGSTF